MAATTKYELLHFKPLYFASTFRNFLIPRKLLRKGFRFSAPTLTIVKCSSDNGEQSSANLKDALSSMIGEQVEELFNREENRDLFDDLEKASMRVEMAKRQLAEIEEQQLEFKRFKDYISHLENRASEIAGCQDEILEARAMIEEAKLSLSKNDNEDTVTDDENEGVDRDEERLESIRAASISAIVGTFAGLPIIFTRVTDTSHLLLPLVVTFISCALFGVTFRYTIRRDLDNIQLKTGTSAAFGFVKGLAMVEGGRPLELNTESFVSHALDGGVYIAENFFVFISAAVVLDYCFKMRLLRTFPMKRSISKGD